VVTQKVQFLKWGMKIQWVQYQDFHSSRKSSVQNHWRGTNLFDSIYCIYQNIRCYFSLIYHMKGEGGTL